MARAGLRRIGDVALRPRAPITARFGAVPIARLDALKGLDALLDRAALSAAGFLRRAAVRLAHRRRSRRSRLPCASSPTISSCCSSGRRRARGGSNFVSTGSTARCAASAVGASRPLNEARAIVRLFAERLASPRRGRDRRRLRRRPHAPRLPRGRAARALASRDRARARGRARPRARRTHRPAERPARARAVTRRELVEAHLPEQAEAAAAGDAGRGAGAQGEGRSSRRRSEAPPARPLRLFVRPEPIEALAEVPDGPPLRFRWRRVLHDVAAIEGPERIAAALVAAGRRADARLFPRRGFPRPPLLALPRGPLGPRDDAGEMVRARGVRVSPSPRLREKVDAERPDEGQDERGQESCTKTYPFPPSAAPARCAPSRRKRSGSSGTPCATVACRR